MHATQVRQAFLNFFKTKDHNIIQSAPLVVKDDPTLMFTNAGMNRFKDIFLGNTKPKHTRIADTQKCLRVSGKHNDLEEVGLDTYHHTMFEMLGNWSLGDYFKKEAIEWAWEFLTEVCGIDKNRIYATVFEGSKAEGTAPDDEAFTFWKDFLDESRIVYGSKKDNFWEMGETGPCGPCSEIHIDLRDDRERKKKDGASLINKDHPLVIEIWNLVFIQYKRKSNGKLEILPEKHIDTGMGFERLCMILQGKQSNYDTDIFQPLINEISVISGYKYGKDKGNDIAMRVIADHIRAIAFAVADGQLPSNIKAGYVIRRILRRAVRYGYSFLGLNDGFLYKLIPVLIKIMGDAYPELKAQQELIQKVIKEEEMAFLKTLEKGIKKFEQYHTDKKDTIKGKFAFELYDTYGFPIDLTCLLAKEKGLTVDMNGFNEYLEQQKDRSRQATALDAEEWTVLLPDDREEFVGYDYTETDIKITKYRKVKVKGNDLYHLVFNITPFYAESGGQVGDTGYLESEKGKVSILDTKKENNITIHYSKELPSDLNSTFRAVVDKEKRMATACNHSATHLLHNALRKVLGDHVEQKGSLVDHEHLRFDFSHFRKMTDEEIEKTEDEVNNITRQNIALEEKRAIPFQAALDMGAIALFGEKYEDIARVIRFGDSIELCGGTHVQSTGRIGYFKIISETAVAAGIRRIEAITSVRAEKYINDKLNLLKEIQQILKNPKDIKKAVLSVIEENTILKKQVKGISRGNLKDLKSELLEKIQKEKGISIIAETVSIDSVEQMRDISFQLKKQVKDMFLVLGAAINNKAVISVMISDELVKNKSLNANNIIKEISAEIKGGGGGQPFYATAGGKDVGGIEKAIIKAKEILIKSL